MYSRWYGYVLATPLPFNPGKPIMSAIETGGRCYDGYGYSARDYADMRIEDERLGRVPPPDPSTKAVKWAAANPEMASMMLFNFLRKYAPNSVRATYLVHRFAINRKTLNNMLRWLQGEGLVKNGPRLEEKPYDVWPKFLYPSLSVDRYQADTKYGPYDDVEPWPFGPRSDTEFRMWMGRSDWREKAEQPRPEPVKPGSPEEKAQAKKHPSVLRREAIREAFRSMGSYSDAR